MSLHTTVSSPFESQSNESILAEPPSPAIHAGRENLVDPVAENSESVPRPTSRRPATAGRARSGGHTCNFEPNCFERSARSSRVHWRRDQGDANYLHREQQLRARHCFLPRRFGETSAQ